MKLVFVFAVALWGVTLGCQLSLAGTIVYSYDGHNRLIGVNYNNQAAESYQYDKADNLIGYTVLTDSQYFKPFLLYFTLLDTCPQTDGLRPKCYRQG